MATAGRKGRERLWDLATRVYPDDPVVPAGEALRIRDRKRLRAVQGTWRVDPAHLGQPFAGRTALLSPFDRLVHDRRRTVELFDLLQLEVVRPS